MIVCWCVRNFLWIGCIFCGEDGVFDGEFGLVGDRGIDGVSGCCGIFCCVVEIGFGFRCVVGGGCWGNVGGVEDRSGWLDGWGFVGWEDVFVCWDLR